ncbi:hypothetical protein HYH03_012193 [Edaphochlamys debaryana]|uniref:Chloride channel protein n=1 Tax=Edaphochlamys debaryana TaxID=47281 RepID=A0A835XSE7_9CHLO|nr:hypothetical protein HYH03_012193 [Edaphochlamys debaryana]|eukprot:KAG2489363.1 hypothetical protein HYH03_012193 [Edaphochlamys debaryana]
MAHNNGPVRTAAEALAFPDMREYARFHDREEEEANEALLGGAPGSSSGLGLRRRGGFGEDEDDVTLGWQRAWKAIFKKGNDVESTRVNHHFTAAERAKLSKVESIDYLAPNSATYRKWLSRQPHRRFWDRWVMMGSIGVATGLVAYLLYVLIALLAGFKYGITRWLLGHTNVGVAWLFNVTVSVALVAASSAAVIGWAPEAQGSGVPEVMAYLNGCMLPKLFNVATLVVKWVSCGLVVASGLPVGPEGPLIHIGAAIGAALSQGHSTTMGFTTQLFRRFRNPKDKRDFVTAGVSVGVAAAFNAPIGGLLFAFEEVASFWQQRLGWQVFYACMCAVLTLNLSRSAGKAMIGKGTFGLFDKEVAFEQAGMSFSSHVLAVAPAAIIGLAAGLLAIVFTVANIKVTRLRAMLSGHLRWKRAIEPCVLAAVYITGCMLLPLLFPCTPAECIVDAKGEMQCNTGLSGQGGIPSQAPSLPLYTCRVVEHHIPTPNVTVDDPTAAPPTARGRPGSGRSPSRGGSSQWLPGGGAGGGGSITPDTPGSANGTATVYYNQLATLLFSTGEEGLKHLFARGTHRRFGYKALLVMGAYYYVFAVLVAGSAVASGLFVPMLMVGAVLGRICGLATVDVAQALGKHWSVDIVGPWTWIDPGVFALVGAGAFMGGVTRMTVALAVIMIEVSSDVHMLLPVLVAIMVAKWVADAATHSLYHGLLEVKCVPFLPAEPVSAFSLDLLPVSYVMSSPVVCLRQRMSVRELTDVLRRCKHNGFPVLRDGQPPASANGGGTPGPGGGGGGGGGGRPGPGSCCGLVTRGHLMVLLQKAVAAGRVDGLEVDWTELNRKMMDPVSAQRSTHAQQMAVLAREMAPEDPSTSAAGARGGGGALGALGGGPAFSGVGYEYGGLGLGPGAAAASPGGPQAAPEGGGAVASLQRGTVLRGPASALRSPEASSHGGATGGGGGGLTFGDEGGSWSHTPGGPSGGSVSAGGYGSGYGAGYGGGAGTAGPHVPRTASSSLSLELFADRSLDSGVIDLTPYINTSAFLVPDTFSVERTYVLFRTMGLRHLIVVDEERHAVKGIVTRKDLLGYRLDDALARALNGHGAGGPADGPMDGFDRSGRSGLGPSALPGPSALRPTGYSSSQLGLGLGLGLGGSVSAGGAYGASNGPNGAIVSPRYGVGGSGPGLVLPDRPSATGGASGLTLTPVTPGLRNLLVNGNVAGRG